MSETASPPPLHQYTCPWCGHASDPASTGCTSCGAPVDVRKVITHSGWTEQPPIRDMARIQFGQSTLQVEGNYVPVADFKLAAGDGVYFAHHLLLWKDDSAQISAMPMKGGWKRLLAGLPLIMTQATGPGRIAFSKDTPGELVAIPLEPGQSVDVREHVFMIATHSIAYDWFNTGIWFRTVEGSGNDHKYETHYPVGMFMDRFTAVSRGLLLIHGAGNIFVRHLAPGQSILIKPTSLLYKEPTVRMNLHFEHPGGSWNTWRSWGNRYLWLRLNGPGKVAVQSHFEKLEDPGYNLDSTEPMCTSHRW
jgi:uncharacterized protein (AIM24 family)